MKNNSTQLELFDLPEQDAQGPAFKADPLRQNKVYGYQKIVFQLITIIFVGLVSFSWGVEKGRKSIAKAPAQPSTAPFVSLSDAINWPEGHGLASYGQSHETETVIKAVSGREKVKTNEEFQKARYTIQVASILRSKNIKKELSRLKNKGYSAFELVKGKYTVICVGKFTLKDQAQKSLVRLRQRYPDCLIRRL